MPHHFPLEGSNPRGRTLILASDSPRRHRLVKVIDINVHIVGSNVKEPPPQKGEAAQAYVQRLALLKAKNALRETAIAIVLGADTAVTIDGDILGKPANAAQAVEMLERLRDREHEVVTGIALMDAATGICSTSAKVSKIIMRDYSDDEIAAYVESGEPFDKAGAYAVQDQKFRPAVALEGCYQSTIGLPVCDVLTLLDRIGAPSRFRQGFTIPTECPDCAYWAGLSDTQREVPRV